MHQLVCQTCKYSRRESASSHKTPKKTLVAKRTKATLAFADRPLLPHPRDLIGERVGAKGANDDKHTVAPAALPPAPLMESKEIAVALPLAKPRDEAIVCEVLRINLLQLQGVDHLTQTFSARYFVHLCIRNGLRS